MGDQFGLGDQVEEGKGKGKEKPKAPELLTAKQIESRLRELVDGIGAFVEEAGDSYCGGILQTRAPSLAGAYARLAQRNKGVRRMLSSLLTTSDWAEVLMLTAGTAIPIAAHHGWVPEGMAQVFTLGLAQPPPSDEVAGHSRRRAEQPAAGYPAPAAVPDPEPRPDAGKVSEVGPQVDENRGDGGPDDTAA